MGPLKGGAEATAAVCAEHPGEPATGRCVTCKKMVCEACGGVVSNRGVYCIDHTPAVTTSASASPGMNPLLGGAGGGDAAAPAAAARARASMDRGMVALIAGIVAVLVFFGVAFGFPGPLRSRDVLAPPAPAVGGGYPGGPGGPGGYAPGGYPGGTDAASPYGSGYSAPLPLPGSTGGPAGSGGPGGPGGPPGGPAMMPGPRGG